MKSAVTEEEYFCECLLVHGRHLFALHQPWCRPLMEHSHNCLYRQPRYDTGQLDRITTAKENADGEKYLHWQKFACNRSTIMKMPYFLKVPWHAWLHFISCFEAGWGGLLMWKMQMSYWYCFIFMFHTSTLTSPCCTWGEVMPMATTSGKHHTGWWLWCLIIQSSIISHPGTEFSRVCHPWSDIQ